MITPFLILPLAAVFQTGQQGPPDQAPERKVRIEIVTTENGETRRVTKEFDATDEQQLQDALRELGVFDHITLGDGERDLTIDIRGFADGVEDSDMLLHLAPMAPLPPLPPMAMACENVGFLGVSTTSLNQELREKSKAPNKEGAYVTHVVDGSAAETLGLKEGDVITEMEGDEVGGPEELTESVRAHDPGTKVKLTWYRDGKKMAGTAELGKCKEESYSYSFSYDGEDEAWAPDEEDGTWDMEQRAFLGVMPANEDGNERDGAVISTVEPGSAAEKMGLKPGDAIRSVNGVAIADFDALAETIRSMKPGDAVTVMVDRGSESVTMNGTLGEHKVHTYIHVPGMGSMQWKSLDPEAGDELRREMDQLRREMSEMRREMGREIRREVRVNVEARKLTEEEKTMLRGKGVAVGNELALGELQAFPNPSNGFYRLQFDVPERGDLNVDVHDAKGERVYQERIVGFKGRYERTLDLSDQATGSYFLVISQGGKATTNKLVKE
jgi:PDZ domain/Secretion system C-terminal sorting domain